MVEIIQTGDSVKEVFSWITPPAKDFATDPSIGPVAPPSDGDRWIVGVGAVGLWAGRDNNIAEYEASGALWVFTVPSEGDGIVVEDLDTMYIYDVGSGWQINANAGIVSQKSDSSGTYITNATGLWENALIDNVTIGATPRTVWAIATFELSTVAGPAAAWNVSLRIRISGSNGSTYVRTLAGASDNGLGTCQHQASGITGNPAITLQVMDDAIHRANVNPIDMVILVF